MRSYGRVRCDTLAHTDTHTLTNPVLHICVFVGTSIAQSMAWCVT